MQGNTSDAAPFPTPLRRHGRESGEGEGKKVSDSRKKAGGDGDNDEKGVTEIGLWKEGRCEEEERRCDEGSEGKEV